MNLKMFKTCITFVNNKKKLIMFLYFLCKKVFDCFSKQILKCTRLVLSKKIKTHTAQVTYFRNLGFLFITRHLNVQFAHEFSKIEIITLCKVPTSKSEQKLR